jgi:hypothetical protein
VPQWHQLVGILRLIDRVLDGKSVMLMDGVRVGKTMQAVGLIACLTHYREHYKKHGKFSKNVMDTLEHPHTLTFTLQPNIPTRSLAITFQTSPM